MHGTRSALLITRALIGRTPSPARATRSGAADRAARRRAARTSARARTPVETHALMRLGALCASACAMLHAFVHIGALHTSQNARAHASWCFVCECVCHAARVRAYWCPARECRGARSARVNNPRTLLSSGLISALHRRRVAAERAGAQGRRRRSKCMHQCALMFCGGMHGMRSALMNACINAY